MPSGSSGAWTMPSAPIGTATPTVPDEPVMRRVRMAASVIRPMSRAAEPTVTTITGVATWTAGARGLPGAL